MTLPDRPVMLVGDSDALSGCAVISECALGQGLDFRFGAWLSGLSSVDRPGGRWTGWSARRSDYRHVERNRRAVTIKVDAGDGYAVIMPRWALGDLLAAITTTSR